jgi:WD40 repeat protein
VLSEDVVDNDRCVPTLTVGQKLPTHQLKSIWHAVTFSANGEYLLSGDKERIRVWRAELVYKQLPTTTLEAAVNCLAVSKDGRLIAAGTLWGDVLVWDAETHEQVFARREDSQVITGVDFSPDSTRLVSASDSLTASIWDIATRERVLTLRHEHWVIRAVKYSPLGYRVATATPDAVRVWDSNGGRLLMDIKVTVTPLFNTGLLWFKNHLFVISRNKIKQFEAHKGSAVSEWPVPESDKYSCIALPKHEEFIAYSAKRTVTFWDTSTHTQLSHIQYPHNISSIAFFPDDRSIAIGDAGKVTINSLSRITVSSLSRWFVAHMNKSIISTRRIRSLCLVYTQHSRNQSCRSTTLCLICGSSINSRTRKHH